MLSTISFRDIAITTVLAVVLAILLRVFVVGVFSIPSHSMENTLIVGDHLLVSKLTPVFRALERGDVIVFTLPDSLRGDVADEPFIKRIVGLPGDTIYLNPLGITVNGHMLPDPPTSANRSPLPDGHKTVIVPENAYYVMGDNRSNSWDSRYWGVLPADRVVGTAMVIYWSRSSNAGGSTIHWERMFTMVR